MSVRHGSSGRAKGMSAHSKPKRTELHAAATRRGQDASCEGWKGEYRATSDEPQGEGRKEFSQESDGGESRHQGHEEI